MTLLQELVRDALDPSVDITTVLRKARVLGARLNNAEFVKWIQNELNGYSNGSDLPEYRVLSIVAKAHLVIGYHQLPSAQVIASQIPERFRLWATTHNLTGSVSELASLLTGDNRKRAGIHCPWPQELAIHYGGSGYGDGHTRVQCIRAWQEISVSSVAGVIETVRNRLLEFVLQIEAEAPTAGEARPGEPPLAQEKVTQIFNNYVSGGVAHIAATDSSRVSSAVQVDE